MEKTPQAKRGGIHNLKHYPMKYFIYSEFFSSDVAEKHQVENIPDDAQLSQVLGNIKALVLNVLDPLRDRVGRPIIILS